MAQDRLLHKRLGHSEKVSHLSDFEYIVWLAYQLSADDYGVMRLSAVTLKADHDRLLNRSNGAIERALSQAVKVGLLQTFEHQSRRYVCQADWQDFQKVRFPAKSSNPVPPPELLRMFSEETRKLFGERSEKTPNVLRENVSLQHVNANANGNVHTDADQSFEEFWKAYPRKVGKEKARLVWRKLRPAADLVTAMLASLGWQCRSKDWTRDGGQFIPHPATWLNQKRWQDEPSGAPERPAWTCPNDPPCPAGTTQWRCQQRADLEAMRVAK